MTGKRLVFAGGAPRSGLTLMRAVFNAHPHVFCGPDSGVLPGLSIQWRDIASQLGDLHEDHFSISRQDVRDNFARAISSVLDQSPAALDKDVIVEKTPLNVLTFEDLAALFPHAKFIHVVRDGRDVAASLLARDWRNPHTGAPFPHVTDAGAAADYWNGLAALGRKAEQAIDDPQRFFTLRYEDLAARPKRAIKALFEFLETPFDPAVLRFYENDMPLVGIERDSAARLRQPISDDRVDRWRDDLSPERREVVERRANGMLRAFNYIR